MAAGLGELTRHITREVTDISFASGDKFVLVAAIDFGTTYSGYAFSFKDKSSEVKTNASWGSEVGATRYKTPTCVVTDNNDHLVAFGYEGLNKYAEDLESHTKYQLYDRFKMNLFKEKVIGAKTTITSRGGRVIQVEIIISLALKYLYDHILKCLQASNISTINKKQIRWVLTVPAIWSEGAKQVMRRAAFKAGIVDSLGSKRLMIALEPEAASFWCRQLTLDQFTGSETEGQNELRMPHETTYMVVDCGGGTIDVTVHQLTANNTVREVHRASGGNWGGTKVDINFLELLEKLFTANFIKKYKQENPQDWLSIMVHFETIKRSFSPKSAQTMNIPLSMNFGMSVMEDKGKKPEVVVHEAQVNGVTCRQGHIILQKDVVEQLFLPSIDKINNHVEELLAKPNVSETKYMFLVGGYGDCKLLQQKVKEKFGQKLKVMVPEDAGMCVMKGAVLFGHKPEAVVSRIARKTYGEAGVLEFIEGKHDPQKKITVEGNNYCNNIFGAWIKKNESVATGESRTFTATPCTSQATESNTLIYSSDKEADDIMYTTDPGVEHIGTLTIKIPDTHIDLNEREIKTHVYFGGTEISVRVEDGAREDGDTAETNIDFLAE